MLTSLILKPLARFMLRLIFRVRIAGIMPLSQPEKLLIIANHDSFLDGLLISLFLPYEPVFIVNTHMAENFWVRAGLRFVDYRVTDPTHPMALKEVIKLIESGKPVMIFPEGRITITGGLMKIYEGPGFAAARTGAAILPVRVQGSLNSFFSRMPPELPRRWFPRITLTLCPIEHIAFEAHQSAKTRRRQTAEQMLRIMQKMMLAGPREKTLYRSLRAIMAQQGAKQYVLEDVKGAYRYWDLLKMTLMLGRLMTRLTAAGTHIGVLMPNLASTVAWTIGTSAVGRVPALLNYKAGSANLLAACRVAGIADVVTSRAFVARAALEPEVEALSAVLKVHYVEDLKSTISWRDKAWVVWRLFNSGAALADIPEDPEAPAVVLFTSGSEGLPKGVVLSHRALLANLTQIQAVIEFSPRDKVFNALPMFHALGLTAGTLLPLLTGMRTYLYTSPLHYRVIPELIYDRNCTVLFGTSTFLEHYALAAHPYDFHRVRYVVAGAEKLRDATRRLWLDKFGLRILEGYGATETAPVLAVNTPMAYRAGTVGRLLPGIEYRLVAIPGIEQGSMLHVRGPNLMSGYYLNDRPGLLTQPVCSSGSGWYETGDIVEIDDDHYVSIVGRLKRFAKIAGEMVSLEQVEQVACRASPQARHAAALRSDEQRGEMIVLFTEDRHLTREILRSAFMECGVDTLALPRRIYAVEALPLLANGKTDYVALAARPLETSNSQG